MGEYYDVDGNEIDLNEWSRLMTLKSAARFRGNNGWTTPEADATRIGYDEIGDVHVSTVWLGMNHQWGDGPPLIFESMIFEGDHDGWQDRYSTKEQAAEGHRRIVEAIKAGRSPDDGRVTTDD